MSSFIIEKSSLKGVVRLSGAKNSALRLICASLLTDEKVIIENFPTKILDYVILKGMITVLGKTVMTEGKTVSIIRRCELNSVLEWKERSIRNTLLILGCLLSRTGFGKVPLPGGCRLGERKYDIHVHVIESLGGKVYEQDEMLCAEAPHGLKGNDIHLSMRSTGATENAILCACLAQGRSRIWNPHIRPEILDLITMLNKMGAKIKVRGQESIIVDGVDGLHGCRYSVIPDNMEAITWLIGTAISGGEVEILDFPYHHLDVPLIFLKESGVKLYRGNNSVIVKGGDCFPIDISTGPYPGINSDMQPLFAAYGSCAKGESRIVDLRFIGRYGYASEFAKMNIKSDCIENVLKIQGGSKIVGANVTALDLRAGAALAILGIVAEGETQIDNAWQIERGYDEFVEKMRNLGGKISVHE